MTAHKKTNIRKIFTEVAGYLASGVIGAGIACTGYELTANKYEAVDTPHARIVKAEFERQLAVIEDDQKDLALTDDEGLAIALEVKKNRFVVDTVMNAELGEQDLTNLALRFNAIPALDGIRFNFPGNSGVYRNECLAEVDDTQPATDAAAEVQKCMAEMGAARFCMQGVLGGAGLLVGMGAYGATTPLRRRMDEKKAKQVKKKKAAHSHARKPQP